MEADPNYPSDREFLNKLQYEPNVDYLYRPSYRPNLDYVYKPVEQPNYDYIYKPTDSAHYGELYDESTLDLYAHLQSRSHCQNPYRVPPNCTVKSWHSKCCKGQTSSTSCEDRHRKSVADENHEYAKRFPFVVDKSHVETINDSKHKKISNRLDVPTNEFSTVYVEKCTSITAVFDAHRRNPHSNICVLNFANPVAPGGEAYKNGQLTQEASLCLQTLLYPTLDGNEMYTANRRAANDMEGSDVMIYSPNVSVFRDECYKELVHPFKVNVISATPVDNRKYECVAGQKIMERRIRKIINLAAYKHADVLILGAFGCGVYKNDPKKISKVFYNVLEREGMKYHFQQVIIPVPEDPLIFDIFNSRFHHK